MYTFKKGLYSDVRIEDVFETQIGYKDGKLEQQKVRAYKGAFIRVFDGDKWYYAATTELDKVQDELVALSSMAKLNENIETHPVVAAFEVHKDKHLMFEDNSVTDIPVEKKKSVLESYFMIFERDEIVQTTCMYVDKKVRKNFYSSKGADLEFDNQTTGIGIRCQFSIGEEKGSESFSKAFTTFEPLTNLWDFFEDEVKKQVDYVKHAENVQAGEYTVVLSPMATGVFTHESFGHKSESDFMVGDETMAKEWQLGKMVAAKGVTIVDDGNELGSGFVQFDDEGTKAKKTMIITDGQLTGRLHSAPTAVALNETLTGNARAMNFEFEPIVRMTTTYIDKGTKKKDEIISEIKEGIFVDTIRHGSGMTTFTIAPNRAYKIENGKITRPLKVSVVTGNVFSTLDEIDGISEEFELLSFVGGGCGKMEQYPLPVGFGGPFIRVKKLNVQ
ncbi:TldD/PmbA family protein [Acidaminobacter sp. JC074]|uniref:TldD/PmbA family protein n=1 Tax=Acidaminobacter sp. JC074 TaxID=2530199 RepID=UPI001F0F7C1D|nr:TldD/PmbA family protein [Acidaminobacter sp. JC074]MCH4891117.1 TldD/PmbA family protein [Acidaminobacter sp. JC074]